MFLVYLAVGALALYLGLMAVRTFASTPPAQLLRLARWLIGGIVVVVALFFLFSGRAVNALQTLIALIPLLVRWRAVFQGWRNTAGPKAGQTSEVATAWLRMTLDHDSGDMDGTVLQGRGRGAKLSGLALADLLALLAELRIEDPDGAQLLEAYLDRAHPNWRIGSDTAQSGAPTSSAAMTHEEAYRVLGLEPGAGEAAIREAHRRLMVRMHPDQGGSTYLAAKINQAKDVLLGRPRV